MPAPVPIPVCGQMKFSADRPHDWLDIHGHSVYWLRWTMRFLIFILLVCTTACGPARFNGLSTNSVTAGWEYFRLGEFDLAAHAFTQAATVPATKAAGLFGLAQTWHLRRPNPDLAQAVSCYRQVVALDPQSDYAAWSWLALAWLQAVPPGGAEPPAIATVASSFQKVSRQFPDHLAGQEAFLALQVLQLQTNTPAGWRAGLAALDGFLQAHPATPYASAVQTLRAHCFRMLHEPAQELAAERRAWQLENDDPLSPKQNPVAIYWHIATIAEFDLGDFTTAREFYQRLIAEYPTEQRVFFAKKELQQMDEIEARIRQELIRGGS